MVVKPPAKKKRRIDLRKTLFVLPNMITLSSIFCGFLSIREASAATTSTQFAGAALLLVFAMFFDMLDGRVARMTKTQSAFGLQIDSLADVVSFGAAPAILVYQWSLVRLGGIGLFISFAFLACGAIRLARFNVLAMGEGGEPSKPSKYIVGLPIPGAAGVLLSVILANHAAGTDFGSLRFAWGVLALTVALSFFMVSTIQFRSFKELRMNAPTVLLVLFAIGSSLVIATQSKPAFVLVWLLGVYVLLGVFETLVNIARRLLAPKRDSLPPAGLPRCMSPRGPRLPSALSAVCTTSATPSALARSRPRSAANAVASSTSRAGCRAATPSPGNRSRMPIRTARGTTARDALVWTCTILAGLPRVRALALPAPPTRRRRLGAADQVGRTRTAAGHAADPAARHTARPGATASDGQIPDGDATASGAFRARGCGAGARVVLDPGRGWRRLRRSFQSFQ